MFRFYFKQLTMITGDNPLTACHVARELRLTRREIVVLSPPENTNNHGNVTCYLFLLLLQNIVNAVVVKTWNL